MADEPNKRAIVLCYERVRVVSWEVIRLWPMVREGDAAHPINLSWQDYTEDRPRVRWADCVWEWSVSAAFPGQTYPPSVMGGEMEYREPHTVGLRRAEAMVTAFKSFDRAMIALAGQHYRREPGDVVTAAAKATGAKWMVKRTGNRPASRWLRDDEWWWHSIAEGRQGVRDMVSQLEREAVEAWRSTAAGRVVEVPVAAE